METSPEAFPPRAAELATDSAALTTAASAAPVSPSGPVPYDRERRRDHRRPGVVKATVTILDGPLAGATHEVLTRDLASGGVSFLLRDAMSVGQTCRVTVQNGRTQSWLGEVVRSRPLSTGKHEMAVQFRNGAAR